MCACRNQIDGAGYGNSHPFSGFGLKMDLNTAFNSLLVEGTVRKTTVLSDMVPDSRKEERGEEHGGRGGRQKGRTSSQ